MKMRFALLAAVSVMAVAQPASAQYVVHDPTSLAKQLIEYKNQLTELRNQVENGRQMISQGKELFDSFNNISNIGDVGDLLNDPTVRQFLPAEAQTLGRALDGDWQSLGEIGNRASDIRTENRIWTPEGEPATEADRTYRAGLDRRGNLIARDIAIGEQVNDTANRRQEGLAELNSALNSADSARAVFDIQARAMIENTMIANDAVRMQGLEMRQRAERELEQQRHEEAQQRQRANRIKALEQVVSGRAN